MDGDFIVDDGGGDYVHCRKTWVRAHVEGEPPQPLVSHTATLWRERYLVVIGGGRHVVAESVEAEDNGDEPPRGQWQMSNDVNVLDLEEMRWSCLRVAGDHFPRRRGHCACLLPRTDRILVFGGTDGDDPSGIESTRSDVCELDVELRLWRVNVCNTGDVPAPRRGHNGWASLDGLCLLVVGGFCSSGLIWSSVYDTSLYSYAPAEARWTRLSTCGEPPLLALAACALTPDRSVVVIVGGAAVYPPFSDGLCLFDQRTLSWSHPQRSVPPQRVARRFSAAAAIVGSTLLLFGGTELNRAAGAHDGADDTHADVQALSIGAELAYLNKAFRVSRQRAKAADGAPSGAPAGTGAAAEPAGASAPRAQGEMGDNRGEAGGRRNGGRAHNRGNFLGANASDQPPDPHGVEAAAVAGGAQVEAHEEQEQPQEPEEEHEQEQEEEDAATAPLTGWLRLEPEDAPSARAPRRASAQLEGPTKGAGDTATSSALASDARGGSRAADESAAAGRAGARAGEAFDFVPLLCSREGTFAAASGARPSVRNGMSMHAIRGGSTLVVVGGGVFRETGGAYFSDVWLLNALREPRLPPPAAGGALGDALGCLLDRPDCADVCFLLDCGSRCYGHAAILGARSEYFLALLAGGFGEAAARAKGGAQGSSAAAEERPVRVRGVSSCAFRAALHFFYTGSLPPSACCWSAELAELLVVSDMWRADGLRAAVEARVCALLQEGEVGVRDALALADSCGCERVAVFAAELRALELLFGGACADGPSWLSLTSADAAAETPSDAPPLMAHVDARLAQLVERRLRRKGFERQQEPQAATSSSGA